MVKLTQEQIQFFKDNGYLKVSGIFTDQEMKQISADYNKIFHEKNNPGMEAAWVGNDMKKAANNMDYSVHSIHNLQFHSGTFSKLLHNDNLTEALEGIMGTPDILLHHTKAHWKPAKNGAPYLMHQDYYYFPYKKDSMVAVFLHIDDSDPENGGLCVYPGSHKLGYLKDFGVIEKGEAYHYADPKKFTIEGATPIIAKAGEVVFFSYLLLHGSYVNLSDRPRRMFLIQVLAADDEPIEDKHKSPGQGWVLRGHNYKRSATMAERFLH